MKVIIALAVIWALLLLWILYEVSVAPLDPYDVEDLEEKPLGENEVNHDLVNYN